jgi:hypothetical protein
MDKVLTFYGIWKTSLPFFYPIKKEILNSPQTLQGLGGMGLGFASSFPHNVKSQAQCWTILKGIQPQLHSVITCVSRLWRLTAQELNPSVVKAGN